MAKYKAIYNRIIGTLSKPKDKSNGEHVQANGLVLVGTDTKAKKDFDKYVATVESVGPEIEHYMIKKGDKIHISHMSGDLIEEYETDDATIQIRSFLPEHVLAVVDE